MEIIISKRHFSNLPTRTQIRRFIEEHPGRANTSDIGRMFGVRLNQRKNLRALIKAMAINGEIPDSPRQSYLKNTLPKVAVIEITKVFDTGVINARPNNWRGKQPPPRISLQISPDTDINLTRGDRLLARLTCKTNNQYSAKAIRLLTRNPREIICVYRSANNEDYLIPIDRRMRKKYLIKRANEISVSDGDVVVAKANKQDVSRTASPRILRKLGRSDNPSVYSLIAMYAHGIPEYFETDVLNEANRVTHLEFNNRLDLRDLDLITIDPDNARDYDDAVWAQPHPTQPNNWEIIVAISDVAHYVRSGSDLDQSAQSRGNSVYFPDRVIPMLPDILSSNICSLRSGNDRPCIALRILIDNEGQKSSHTFMRAIVRVRQNLTYKEAQRYYESMPQRPGNPLSTLDHLFGAYHALNRASCRRSPLNIETCDRQIELSKDGQIVATQMSPQSDSQRLIEEFMVLANTCAAETLDNYKSPCLYRVHDRPDAEKVKTLQYLLKRMNLQLTNVTSPEPHHFNKVLELAASQPHSAIVGEAILRAQSQACYSTINSGHYGLTLTRYTHFTSPIRRYADLLVHRALIDVLGLGKDEQVNKPERLQHIADKLSKTERRTALAEREATDKFVATFIANKIGDVFHGYISGVERFGLFINIPELSLDGLIPISSLSDDYYCYEPSRRALVSHRHGTILCLGDSVNARLVEANPIGGSLRFELSAINNSSTAKTKQRGKRPYPVSSTSYDNS
tara:strand:- start:2071 stop:4290 length:2220 start_codon:yes stop_codon:yes gene_type:complete